MAKLFMLTETSQFMMSFVIITEKNNAIIVDGGRQEDMPLLKKYVGNRKVKAWILTHPHTDHISGFTYEMGLNGCADFDLDTVYYNFVDYDKLIKEQNVPDRAYFEYELNEFLPKFNEIKNNFAEKTHIVKQGDKIKIDEVEIEFLYTHHKGLYANLMNDSSLVFKLKTPKTSVLFLGDLGPDGGDILYRESRDKLKADYVQMAHHGHMNVSMEVYQAVSPKACFWCAPLWLYNEPEIPKYLEDTEYLIKAGRIRMYGTAVTRKWMDALGVKKHYVSGEGTVELDI
ncbi:MAG: MBL fold metallo-hydrolase [Clostridia bacterium]|nr:MBL fold metallo-hydrolase [Clostridia bacterium]